MGECGGKKRGHSGAETGSLTRLKIKIASIGLTRRVDHNGKVGRVALAQENSVEGAGRYPSQAQIGSLRPGALKALKAPHSCGAFSEDLL